MPPAGLSQDPRSLTDLSAPPLTPLRVGMAGYAFMGRAHSHAFRTVNKFFDLPYQVDMRLVTGRDALRVGQAANRLGWSESSTRWQDLVEREDIDLVDIASPGETHAEIAIAALAAGKHVLCEKPLANTLAEAEAMAQAAASAATRGVYAMVGFTYRRVPAITLAASLVAQGRIGAIRQVRARYLQDWLADPEAGWSWRLDEAKAGSGALGDIGAHIIDAVQFITADRLVGVSGLLDTFTGVRLDGAGTERPVTVDDAAVFYGRLSNGAVATFEASRVSWGRKNSIQLEIVGTLGALSFDLEDLNVLNFYDSRDVSETAGFRRIVVTEPAHPYVGSWWPAGHMLGYEHSFTHQMADLVTALANGSQPTPSFADGLQVQRVLDAVGKSAAAGGLWQPISDAPSAQVAAMSSSHNAEDALTERSTQ